jgi:hypothetical protein
MLGIIDGDHQEEVVTLMHHDHLNPCSLCKGAAMCAVSGTTASPSMPSIACLGEWSALGAALGVCWHFASVEDHCLGRILSRLDPNSPDFGILPPSKGALLALSTTSVTTSMAECSMIFVQKRRICVTTTMHWKCIVLWSAKEARSRFVLSRLASLEHCH